MYLWIWWATGLTITLFVSLRIIKKSREFGLIFLNLFFAGYVLSANLLAPRLINFDLGFEEVSIVTGSIIWPFTSQLSDMINEVYGKRKTLVAMVFAYLLNLLFITFVLMASNTTPVWSAAEEQFWQQYFSPTAQIFLASSVSFIVCQVIDIYIFSYLKEKFRKIEETSTGFRIAFLAGVRSLSSDVINMIFDGVIFAVIAFGNKLPADALFKLITGSIVAKSLLAIFDTPWYIIFRIGLKQINRER